MTHANPAGVDDPFLIGARVYLDTIRAHPEGIVIGKCFSLDMQRAWYVVEYNIGFTMVHEAHELEQVRKSPDSVRLGKLIDDGLSS